MSDSSSCELVRISSNPMPVQWEACPATTEFKLKMRKAPDKASKMVVYVYTLKEGTPLPYKPSIPTAPGWLIMKKVKLKLCDSGLELVFSKTMKPVLDGRIGWEDEKGYWIFEGNTRAGK